MTISAPVREYYAVEIFAKMTRDLAPPRFRPLEVKVTGRSLVKGCRGEGKDLLTIELHEREGVVQALRAQCGLCAPAMLVAADIVVRFATTLDGNALLAVDPLDRRALAPLFSMLPGTEEPEDAREKFQYALFAVQNALRDSRGEAAAAVPDVSPPEG